MQFLGLAFQIATLIVGGILGGLAVGYAADKLLNTYPIGLLTGIILGIAASGLVLYKQIDKLSKAEEKEENSLTKRK